MGFSCVRAHPVSTKTSRLSVAVVALWYALTITTGIVSPEILAALMKTARTADPGCRCRAPDCY